PAARRETRQLGLTLPRPSRPTGQYVRRIRLTAAVLTHWAIGAGPEEPATGNRATGNRATGELGGAPPGPSGGGRQPSISRRAGTSAFCEVSPPSMTSVCPVMYFDSSEAR